MWGNTTILSGRWHAYNCVYNRYFCWKIPIKGQRRGWKHVEVLTVIYSCREDSVPMATVVPAPEEARATNKSLLAEGGETLTYSAPLNTYWGEAKHGATYQGLDYFREDFGVL